MSVKNIAFLWATAFQRPYYSFGLSSVCVCVCAKVCSIPEVLDVVLNTAEMQTVGQGLVVCQSLSGRAPVHIWKTGQTVTFWSQDPVWVAIKTVRPLEQLPCSVGLSRDAVYVCVEL